MKTKTRTTSTGTSRDGGILVLVMVILVAFSLLTVSLLNLGKFNSIETTHDTQRARAFWIAEAGLSAVLARIQSDEAFRENIPLNEPDHPDDVSFVEMLGGTGEYKVLFYKEEGPGGPAESTIYILSTGRVDSPGSDPVEAQVQAKLTGAPGIRHALMGFSNSKLTNPGGAGGGGIKTIEGPIYVSGHLEVGRGNITITEPVELGGETSTSNYEPSVTVEEIEMPPFTETAAYRTFTNLLAQAAVSTNKLDKVEGDYSHESEPKQLLYNATGKTLDIGDVKNATIVVYGGSVTSGRSTIGDNVTIISQGNVTFRNQTTLANEAVVFTEQNIEFTQAGSTGDGATLIAMGDIIIRQNMQSFKGIMYSEGDVIIHQNATIEGAVIAKGGFNLYANVHLKYNPEVFSKYNWIEFTTWVLTRRQEWAQSPFQVSYF